MIFVSTTENGWLAFLDSNEILEREESLEYSFKLVIKTIIFTLKYIVLGKNIPAT